MKLGRKGPRPAHYIAGRHYLALDPSKHLLELPPAPPDVDLTPGAPIYMGHNDDHGTCGVVALTNLISTQCAREGRTPAFVTLKSIDDSILDYYFRYTGGVDEGVVMLDFLFYAQKNGFMGEQIGTPIAIDPKNWEHVKIARALDFGLMVGAELPLSSQDSDFWRDGTETRDLKPWGGHAMMSAGSKESGSYGEPNAELDSWRSRFYCTRSWWTKRVDEAYIVIDLARATVPGVNMDALRASAAELEVPGSPVQVAVHAAYDPVAEGLAERYEEAAALLIRAPASIVASAAEKAALIQIRERARDVIGQQDAKLKGRAQE